jgi:hypothetical protein
MSLDPGDLIGYLDDAIAEVGENVTLQRIAVDSQGAETIAATVTCRACVRATQPQDIVASDVRDTTVIVSPTGLGSFGVPAKDTRIIIQGSAANVESIEPIYVQGVLVRVNMQCRG